MNHEEKLTRALREQADQIDSTDHPITLSDVKGTAKGLQRRRMAVSGLAAAAVLAIAVPAGMAMNGRFDSSDRSVPPIANSSTPSPTDDPSPTPTGTKKVVLTTQVEAQGGEPGIPYLFDGAINLPDGSQVPVEGDYDGLVALGDGWVVSGQDENANRFVYFLDSDGQEAGSSPLTGSLAVSPDGTVAAWTTPDGAVMTKVAGKDPVRINATEPKVAPRGAVGVFGSGTCLEAESEIGGCTVFYNVEGTPGAALRSSSHGITDSVADFLKVGGVTSDGWSSGVISIADDGSCSAVINENFQKRWATCDYTLGQFSPDGKYIIGKPAYLDGIGDGSVAILDAATGDVLANYRSKTYAFINNSVWDTDNTLLATVFEEGWSLMRMTPDGQLSSVSAGGLAGGDIAEEVPLHLSSRP